MVNATRLVGRDGHMLNVVDPADFTEAETLGRRQVRDYARLLAKTVPGCENSYVVDTGAAASISIDSAVAFRNLDPSDVRAVMKANGSAL